MDSLLRVLRLLVCMGRHSGFSRLNARMAVALVGLALSSGVFAAGEVTVSGRQWTWVPASGNTMTNGRYLMQSPASQAAYSRWTYEAATRQFEARGVATIPGRAGAFVAQSAFRVGVGDAAAAVARCLMGGGVICGAASAAALAYGFYRVYSDYTGGLYIDPGQSEQQSTAYACRMPGRDVSFNYATASAACGALVEQAGGGTYTATNVSCPRGGFTSVYTTIDMIPGGQHGFQMRTRYAYAPDPSCIGLQQAQTTYVDLEPIVGNPKNFCPEYTDNAGVRQPAGAAKGFDGKCHGDKGGYLVAGVGDAVDWVRVQIPETNDQAGWERAVADALGPGGQSAPGAIVTTGPGSQVGAPTTTTTTGPNGTTTTTQSPTYNYQYDGDTVNYGTTITTTIINENGDTTTTTVVNNPPESAPEEEKDPCEGNPDRLSCVKLGEGKPIGQLYKKKDRTWNDVFNDFTSRMRSAPVLSAANNYFGVQLSGGACPHWEALIDYLDTVMKVDFMCSETFSALLVAVALVVNVLAGWAAFRVAFDG